MTFEIKLSQLQDREQFEQAVAEHVDRLANFNREVGKPRPVAHPLVEASVKRISHPKGTKLPDDYMVDYVIVDDTQPPVESINLNLEDKKSVLAAQLRAAEHAAKVAVLPQRKHRILQLQTQNANAKIKYDTGIADYSELTEADTAVIEHLKKVQAAYAVIELIAAQAESDIEDLTDDTVDKWQVPNLG